MIALHPTDLALGAEHCWHALDHREAGVPYDRSVFTEGIAAHAALEAVGRNPGADPEAVRQAVVVRLAGEGRSWDGVPEPPLPIEPVLAGVALGLRWHATNPVPQGARYEVGVAVDADFRAVPYDDPAAAFRTILDLVDAFDEQDEEGSRRVLLVRDYKSSWRDRENALDSLQRRAQAVLALACLSEAGVAHPDVLRLEVCNLRVGATYTRDIDPAADSELLASWRTDLLLAREASLVRGPDGNGRRPASPGVRCVGCPYVLSCDGPRSLSLPSSPSPVDIATVYATRLAEVKELEAWVREAVGRTGSIETPDGSVGYLPFDKREPVADAYAKLWDAWAEGGKRDARGLLKALGLGVGSIEKAAKVLFGLGRGAAGPRREWVSTLITTTRSARLGVRRTDQGQGEDDDAQE